MTPEPLLTRLGSVAPRGAALPVPAATASN
jgi:hypothetical protein